MNFFKTSFWSALSTIIKVLASIITTKVIAILVGPNGVALLGNYTNVTGILLTFSNGAISSGITKYISEFELEEEKKIIVSHSLKITLFCSSILGVVILVINKFLSKIVFGTDEYKSVFILIGLTLIFFGLNTTISAIYNGYRLIRYLIITGIIGSILSVIVALVITLRFGLFGALINIVIAQIFIFIINIKFIRDSRIFELKDLFQMPIDNKIIWKLLRYAVMSLISAIFIPMSTFIIRKYIIDNFSTTEAGYIQGVWSISGAYLMVVTTTLSIYYLPTLSRIKNNYELRLEIFRGYKFLLPMTILGGFLIYVCRDLIIYVLYTPEFIPMRNYFTFQIIGDSLKIASWILAFIMVAKAMTKWFILSEILYSVINVIISILFIKKFGPIGATYAYSLVYTIYLFFLIILFKKLIFYRSYTK